MRGALALVLASLLAVRGAAQPGPPPALRAPADTVAAAGLRVYLLTFGPGDAIWERFGHNAIWVHDEASGTDLAYNWGIFDFRQPGFLRRFLVGDPLYSTEAFPAQAMTEFYAQSDRSTWMQELALPAEQRVALRDFVEWNARPENKLYRYDYFRDNCSTRVRDALDRALGGALRRALADTTELTYRSESLRLMAGLIPAYAGMDVALGEPADRPLTRWEAGFIPMRLRDAVRTVRVPDGRGGVRPLVASERELYTARRPAEDATPPLRLPWFLLFGVGVAALIVFLTRRAERGGRGARRGVATLGAASGALDGIFGLVLTLAWAATSHFAWYRNENLFQFSPIALFLAVAFPLALRARASERSMRAARRLTAALAALSVLGFLIQVLPGFDQSNGSIIAAAMPVHLALAWAAWRLTRSRFVDERVAP